ncbi:MAG: hypothetical protein JW940_01545 [Polyangiaceae bacterium]|nr:hypothetical protein [Polyangiaceae bacterium]
MTRLAISHLLPPARNDYAGPRIALWFLALANLLGTARGFVHVLMPSQGIRSAEFGLPLLGRKRILELVEGVRHSMVVLTMQWGAAELLLALVIWIVLWRYRSLAPLMILVVIAEMAAQIMIGLPHAALNSANAELVRLAVLFAAFTALGISLLHRDGVGEDGIS